MTLEQLAYLGEIVGVILVIASLVYVAQQLRQNTETMRAASRNSIQHGHQTEILTLVQYPEIWRGFTGQTLDDENIQINLWLTASLRAREHEWYQYRHGALDELAWQTFAKAILIVLSSDRARGWWIVSKQQFDDEFSNKVDELLKNESDMPEINVRQAATKAQSADRD